jgi:hypothetical protein
MTRECYGPSALAFSLHAIFLALQTRLVYLAPLALHGLLQRTGSFCVVLSIGILSGDLRKSRFFEARASLEVAYGRCETEQVAFA